MFRTSIPGIFAIGDVAAFPLKVGAHCVYLIIMKNWIPEYDVLSNSLADV